MRITKVIVCFVKSTLRKARSLCSVDLIFCPKYGMAIAKRRKLRYDICALPLPLHRGAETQNRGSKRFRKRPPLFHKKVHRMFKTVSSDAQLRGRHWGGLCTEFPGTYFRRPAEKGWSSNMIEVKNLTKRYGTNTALNNVSFTVEEGTIVGFLGPNGAGKSTTMNIITGYLSATSGSVTVQGKKYPENPNEVKKAHRLPAELPPLLHGYDGQGIPQLHV